MKVFQIYITDDNSDPSDIIQKKINITKKIYNNYEYSFFKDDDCKKFLHDNFPKDVLYAYNKLNSFAFKSDLVRYCLLYTYGGIYFDVGIYPEFKIEHNKNIITYNGPSNENSNMDTIDPGFLYFKYPKHKFLKEAIDKSVENILNSHYGIHMLDITGPIMLGRLNFKYNDIDLANVEVIENRKCAVLNNIVLYKYKEKHLTASLDRAGCTGVNNYGMLWAYKKIYKEKE